MKFTVNSPKKYLQYWVWLWKTPNKHRHRASCSTQATAELLVLQYISKINYEKTWPRSMTLSVMTKVYRC